MYTTQIDHMNLHQIANSGQCFRWQQINDNTYKIPAFGKELTITQDRNTFILSCDESEWNSLWKNYFDVDTDTDYNEVENIIMESNDDFLKDAYQLIFKGVYVRTNLFEIVNDLINSQVNPRLRWDSFLDNILPIDTSYYIDVDLGRCRDIPVIQEIHLKKDGDTYKMVD